MTIASIVGGSVFGFISVGFSNVIRNRPFTRSPALLLGGIVGGAASGILYSQLHHFADDVSERVDLSKKAKQQRQE